MNSLETHTYMNSPLHNRLDYIDSLRAIAALLVVWIHVSEVFISLPGVSTDGDSSTYTIYTRVGVGSKGE